MEIILLSLTNLLKVAVLKHGMVKYTTLDPFRFGNI